MFTQDLRSKIDQVWLAFHSGGISNPLSVIEQITYLLFLKMLDEQQTAKEQTAMLLEMEVENPIYTKAESHLRWKNFKNLPPEEGGAFDFMKNYGGKSAAFSKFMKNAKFEIPTARLLAQVVDMLSEVVMKDTDTKGDVYEYMLSKLATAKQNGQFRTPRHITKMMVELMKPTPEDVICDPAAGTCGFLVSSTQGTERSRELFEEILEGRPLGVFIRSVVGMDRNELKKAFAKVSNYSRFNFKQMEFIDVIIDSVAKNGILELNKLSENPQLQNIYSGGIIELFGTETAKEIFSVLKDVNNSVA